MKKISFSTTQIIMFSFGMMIFIGSILLSLPISSASGEPVPYIDALFTATTSVCVTGLVTVPTVSTWSFFGQFVIMMLIQVGGLGVITVISGVMIVLHQKIGLKNRILLQDAFNLNTLSGIVVFIKKVLIGTFIVEGIGAILYMTVFVKEFGVRGIWISIFNSVSAFCNAGIDIIAENSLCNYVLNYRVNFITMALIILGGIGYIVWWDVLRVLKELKNKKLRCFSNLTLHSKIAITVTGVLIIGGTLALLLFEYNNSLTIKEYSLFDKILVCAFQSVSTRTAGFATIAQENLTNSSAIVSILLMFVGGSPVGTAGGVKTVTIAVLIFSAFAITKNQDEVSLFHRTIPKEAVNKAVAVVSMSFMIVVLSTLLLSAVTNADVLDITYETVSAAATVGFTRNLTSSLNMWGKLIIIMTMYLGRVGPISLVIAFHSKRERKNLIKNPAEEISIG